MQEEFFGFGTIDKLSGIINRFDVKKIFLVTGKKSFFSSGAQNKIEKILGGISYTRFAVSGNPRLELIENGIKAFQKFNPDIVIAVGGGSAIDAAKIINALSYQNDRPEEYIKGKKLECNDSDKCAKPLIAIPTTAGTGSESTHFATIYIEKKKYSLADKHLMLPTISIVDPSLTESLPQYVTATTGLDAICQGIESFWSINSSRESREYAIEAVKIGLENIEKAVNNPDQVSRLNMAKAAHLSGKAINISKTTACHSVSYPLTSYFGVPHGHAVALIMPSFLEFNSLVSERDCSDGRGVGFVMKRMSEIFSIMGVKDGTEAKEKFSDLLNNILKKTRLRDFGIDRKDLEMLLKESFTPNRMNNNPRRVSKEGLRKILEDIW